MFLSGFVRLRQPWRWLPFGIRLRWARVRRALVRHRVVRRTVTAFVVVLAVGWIALTLERAENARQRWGVTRTVVVASTDHDIGPLVDDAIFSKAEHPVALLPDDALSAVPEAGDRIVGPLRAGDVVTERHLASTRAQSIDVPDGQRAIGVPVGRGLPPLRPGDRVDVLTSADPFGGIESLEVEASSSPGLVLLVDDEVVTIAVSVGDVVAITESLRSGRLAIALR